MKARLILFLTGALLGLIVLVPGAAGATFCGVPLTGTAWLLLAAALAVAALAALAPPERAVPRGILAALVALLVVKCVAGGVAPSLGWRGVYFMDGTSRVDFKHGVRTRPFRIDPRIDFVRGTFGLHFLNDPNRYGTHYSHLPRHFEFPLRVQWTGYVWLERPAAVRFRLEGEGDATVVAGGRTWQVHLDRRPGLALTAELPAGATRLFVAYDKPAHHTARLRVAVLDGHRELPVSPAGDDAQRAANAPAWQAVSDASVGVAVLLAVWAVAGAYRFGRPLLGRLRRDRELAGGVVTALVFSAVLLVFTGAKVLPLGTASVNLVAGDDTLRYEGYARNILFHGLLMPNGSPVGQGLPYYHYPFYSYVLALAHLLLGEPFATVVFVNVLSVSSLLLLAWALGWRRLSVLAASVGAGALGLFIVRHLIGYTVTSFSDNGFISLVFVALVLAWRAAERGRRRDWILAGIATAWAAAARPSFLTFVGVFPAAIVLFGTWRPPAGRMRQAALFVAGVFTGLAPFSLRNWIMTGRFVLLVSSWIQIPYFLFRWDQVNPVRQVSGLPEAVSQAIEIFRATPGTVIDTEVRKLLFSLGLTQAGPPHVGAHWDLVVLPVLFVAALACRRIPRALGVVVSAFAVSHIVAMVLAAPWTYGYKTILPLHAVFLFGAVYLVPGATPVRPIPGEAVGAPGESTQQPR